MFEIWRLAKFFLNRQLRLVNVIDGMVDEIDRLTQRVSVLEMAAQIDQLIGQADDPPPKLRVVSKFGGPSADQC